MFESEETTDKLVMAVMDSGVGMKGKSKLFKKEIST